MCVRACVCACVTPTSVCLLVGKTTLLLALSQLVCEELKQRRSRSLQLMISAVGITPEQAETLADMILDSLDSKHALLVWTR